MPVADYCCGGIFFPHSTVFAKQEAGRSQAELRSEEAVSNLPLFLSTEIYLRNPT